MMVPKDRLVVLVVDLMELLDAATAPGARAQRHLELVPVVAEWRDQVREEVAGHQRPPVRCFHPTIAITVRALERRADCRTERDALLARWLLLRQLLAPPCERPRFRRPRKLAAGRHLWPSRFASR